MLTRSYNLLNERWLDVLLLDGSPTKMSIREVFHESPRIASLEGDIASVRLALHRLLIAILFRAVPVTDPRAAWRQLWNQSDLPVDMIDDYLDRWSNRFDLLDPLQPFLQVASLATAKGTASGLEKLIADVPNGHPYFTTRAGPGLRSIALDEGARWLVHVQAFDPSGIKSGAVGDPRVKAGKGFPIGTAWAGNLGGILVEGNSLKETLLLNLPLGRPDSDDEPWSTDEDRPVWERVPLTAAEEMPNATTGPILGRRPTGPADLLTWPSRRVRLVTENDRVIGVIVANGDVLWPQNRFSAEPMSAWRRSEPQSKKYSFEVFMPRQHDVERSLWRGAGALIPHADTIRQTADGSSGLVSPNLAWLGGAVVDVLGAEYLLRTRAIGIAYGSNNSVIDEVYDDSMVIHAAVLSSRVLQEGMIQAIARTDQAVQAVGDLGRDLEQAAGGDGPALRDSARSQGFARLDLPFRRWLPTLRPDTDIDAALSGWFLLAYQLLMALAAELIQASPPSAWSSRTDPRGSPIDIGIAQRRFLFALRRALPFPQPELVTEGAQ